MAASPCLTCMLCCGFSTRDWLSPAGRLLEALVRARGCGLSTKNGGWHPSLKCRSISELFFSWRVCVMSNSCTASYGAKQPEKRLVSMTGQKYSTPRDQYLGRALQYVRALFISVIDFPDLPPSLILPSLNHRLRHETLAPLHPPPSAPTACSNREPRGRHTT